MQLTYCNLDTIELTKTAFLGNLKYFRETFSFAELAEILELPEEEAR